MEEEDLSLQHQSPEVPAQSQPPEADLRQSTASTPSLTDDGASKSLNKKLGIRLPETGIVLDRLPPITDQVFSFIYEGNVHVQLHSPKVRRSEASSLTHFIDSPLWYLLG